MILATHGFLASSIGQIDADAQAFFDRVTTAGGSLSTTEKNAVNTLVIQMKTDGIWTKIKAVYPMVGASAAACAQNLKSSSFTGTFTSGWTFASTGATPNGTSAFMDTNLTPSISLQQNSTHLSYYSRTNISANQVEIGSANYAGGAKPTYLLYNFSGTTYKAINNVDVQNSILMTPTIGMLIGSRINSTNAKYYHRGTLVDTITANSVQLNDLKISLAAQRQSTTINQNFSSKECAFASIGDGLSDTEASNFYTAVQAFQTTLSRNV